LREPKDRVRAVARTRPISPFGDSTHALVAASLARRADIVPSFHREQRFVAGIVYTGAAFAREQQAGSGEDSSAREG
jgi:hypothetical protein